MPDEPEAHGLLALMLLHDSRREARFRDGELVLLAEQDRSLWDAAQIAEGRVVLDRALALRGNGPYVLQAAIASLHARASRATGRRSPRCTASWPGSPTRRSWSSTGRWRWRRPRARRPGWRSSTASPLGDYRYLHSTRAELLRRLGRTAEARDAYDVRWTLVHDDAERRLFERRLAELEQPSNT